MDRDFENKIKTKKRNKKIIIAVFLIIVAIGIISGIKTGKLGPEKKVNIEIRCDQLSEDMNALKDPALKKYIPKDGTILNETEVKIKKGESAFDVTEKVCKEKNIHLDANYSPVYESHYVKGLGYLYEFSAGKNSGWMYKINGESPNYGSDKIKLKGGEKILWYYSIDYQKN